MVTPNGAETRRAMSAGRPRDDAERQRVVARRILAPGGAASDRGAADLVEPVHVAGLERLGRLLGEARGNPGDVEVDAVAPAQHIELVEITDALAADQRRDGAAGDLE